MIVKIQLTPDRIIKVPSCTVYDRHRTIMYQDFNREFVEHMKKLLGDRQMGYFSVAFDVEHEMVLESMEEVTTENW